MTTIDKRRRVIQIACIVFCMAVMKFDSKLAELAAIGVIHLTANAMMIKSFIVSMAESGLLLWALLDQTLAPLAGYFGVKLGGTQAIPDEQE